MMTFYVHPKTIRYTDYGDLLDTVEGIAWSTDNENAFGFERGVTFDEAQARVAAVANGHVEVKRGTPIVRTVDMNPHGLI